VSFGAPTKSWTLINELIGSLGMGSLSTKKGAGAAQTPEALLLERAASKAVVRKKVVISVGRKPGQNSLSRLRRERRSMGKRNERGQG